MKSIKPYYPKRFWYRKSKRWRPPPRKTQNGKEVNHLATQTRSLLNRKAVTQFIKENRKHITQVESTFYSLLEQKIKNTILKAIGNNASRHRLSQYELSGNANSKGLGKYSIKLFDGMSEEKNLIKKEERPWRG